MSSPRRLKVVLASPGDVKKERDLVPGVIEEVNRGTARALGVELVLLRWETDAYPGFHADGGQGIVDRVLGIADCDLLIGLFWTRFGSKVPSRETSTEHEIRVAIKAKGNGSRPQIMLYFSDQPVALSAIDEEQSIEIKRFRKEIEKLGLYWFYKSPTEFERILRTHLSNWLHSEQARPIDDSVLDKTETSIPKPVSPKSIISNGLPPRNPLFTGREPELIQVHSSLKAGLAALTSGVAALQGLGGEGKTQTAIEYAYRHAEEYNQIFFIRAEKPGEFEAQIASLAKELGIPEYDQEAQYGAVHAWFANNPKWLLVIDNAENLTDLSRKLPRNPEGRILITTRERVMPRFGSRVEIAHLDDATGALLLLRCAGRLRPDQSLNDAPEKDREDARSLSATLGGLALALDHAGTYMAQGNLTPEAYQRLYQRHRTRLLEEGENPDHATVTVTFALALAQVERIPHFGAASAQLVRLCAFLAPDAIPDEIFRSVPRVIDPPLSGFVKDDLTWQRVVEAATRFSLLRRDSVPAGFSLHRLIAEVVREGMDEEGHREWTERAVAAANASFPFELDYAEWALCTRMLPHAMALRDAIGQRGIFSEFASRLLNQAALYLRRRGRFREARDLQREVVEMDRTLYKGDHPNLATGLANLGATLTDLGEYGKAANLLKRAVAMDERMSDVDPLDAAARLDRLASVFYRQDRAPEAVALWRQALTLTEEKLGPDHLVVSRRLNSLVNGLADCGEFAEAERLALRGLEIDLATIGENHPEHATALGVLGGLYLRWGKFDRAEKPLRRSLDLRDSLHNREHPDCAHARFQLAVWHERQGQRASARTLLREALMIEERLLGSGHPHTIDTRRFLTRVGG